MIECVFPILQMGKLIPREATCLKPHCWFEGQDQGHNEASVNWEGGSYSLVFPSASWLNWDCCSQSVESSDNHPSTASGCQRIDFLYGSPALCQVLF